MSIDIVGTYCIYIYSERERTYNTHLCDDDLHATCTSYVR